MAGGAVDFACGAVGGALADTCLFPLDTLRARLMVSPVVGRGMLREGLALVRSEGAGALYKGLPPHLHGWQQGGLRRSMRSA